MHTYSTTYSARTVQYGRAAMAGVSPKDGVEQDGKFANQRSKANLQHDMPRLRGGAKL